jgi:hypothetical protein
MRRRHTLAAVLFLAAVPAAQAADPHAAVFAESLRIQQPHERFLHLVLSLPGTRIAEVQTRHMRLISAPDRAPEQRGLVLAAGQALGANGPEGVLAALVPTDRLENVVSEIRRDGTIVAEISRLGDLATRETALATRLAVAQTLRTRLADLQSQAQDPIVAYQAFTQAQSETNRLSEELEAVRFGRQRAAVVVSYTASDVERPPSPQEIFERQVRLAGHLGMAATPLAILLGLGLAGLVSRRRRAKAAGAPVTPPAAPAA